MSGFSNTFSVRAESVRLCCDEPGRRLEARAAIAGRMVHAWDRARVRILCARAGLSPDEEAWLRTASRTECSPATAQIEVEIQRVDLAARVSEAGLRLLAAHDNATREVGSPLLMGVVNVTPDSFSDGGAFRDPARAVEHGLALVSQGADLLDIGGESTRPGAPQIGLAEELARVLPVVRTLARRTSVPLSIDTRKAAVARAALEAGATIVNDVSALTHDKGMLDVLRTSSASVVLMHMQGTPATMQIAPSYSDPVREVLAFLRARVAACLQEGIEPARITIDPGIGFGKRLEDNLALLRAIPELRSLGLPVLIGVSRKAFLGALSGETCPAERLHESAAAVASAALLGAEILRVHDVGPMKAVLRVTAGIAGVSSSPGGSATPPCASSPGPSRS